MVSTKLLKLIHCSVENDCLKDHTLLKFYYIIWFTMIYKCICILLGFISRGYKTSDCKQLININLLLKSLMYYVMKLYNKKKKYMLIKRYQKTAGK